MTSADRIAWLAGNWFYVAAVLGSGIALSSDSALTRGIAGVALAAASILALAKVGA